LPSTPAKTKDHDWQDDALSPKGRAWMAGVRFVCRRCKVERRRINDGDDSRYFDKSGRMVRQLPACAGR